MSSVALNLNKTIQTEDTNKAINSKDIINKKKKKIKLTSEAFPKNELGELKKINSIARIHEILIKRNIVIDKAKIVYKEITECESQDLYDLHKEWFPINYSKEFFERVLMKKLPDLKVNNVYEECKNENNKNNCKNNNNNNNNYESQSCGNLFNQTETLGAFILIDSNLYLIGCITCEIHSEKEFIFNTNSNLIYNSNSVNYYNIFDNKIKFAYIMTLGVINEARRMNISTELIHKMQYKLALKYKNMSGYYLHVIEYNKNAIKFYEKNDFINQRKWDNYYNIKDKIYSSYVFYKLFNRTSLNINCKSNIIDICLNIILFPLIIFIILLNYVNNIFNIKYYDKEIINLL